MRRAGRLDRRLHSAYVFVRRGFPAKRRCEVAWGSDVSALCRKDSRSGASRSGRLRTVCGAGRKAAPMAKFAVTNWRILESAKLRPGIMVGDARVCGCEQLENACEIVMGSILRPRRQDDLAPGGSPLRDRGRGGGFSVRTRNSRQARPVVRTRSSRCGIMRTVLHLLGRSLLMRDGTEGLLVTVADIIALPAF